MCTLSLLIALAIATLASANDIAFIYPPSQGASITLYRNERININWTTTFDRNTLTALQGPDDEGNYALQRLQNNMPRNITNFEWTAGPVNDQFQEYPIHFQISNSECTNCDGEFMDSINLRILSDEAPTSTRSSATSSATATAKSSLSSSSTSISSPTATSATPSESSTARDVGIGVGVVGGIIAILAVLGLAAFCRRRKRKRFEPKGESGFPPLDRTDKMGYVTSREYESPFGSPSQQPLYQACRIGNPAQELTADIPRCEPDASLLQNPEISR